MTAISFQLRTVQKRPASTVDGAGGNQETAKNGSASPYLIHQVNRRENNFSLVAPTPIAEKLQGARKSPEYEGALPVRR